MRIAFVVILIPALLFASVAPTYAWGAPEVVGVSAEASDGPSEPIAQPQSDEGEQQGEGEDSTTTAPPPVGLTPRAESFEAFERGLRASFGREGASIRFGFCDAWETHVHRKPARLELLARRSRIRCGALRAVAPCIQSNAPPIS